MANKEIVSLIECLELRVALSEQQRKEYRGIFSTPEQFSIAFDGRLFFASCEVQQLCHPNSIGQAARDFLTTAATAQPFLKLLDSGGPTPIHPDIFLVAVESAKDVPPLSESQMMSFAINDNDLLVLYPSQFTFNVIARRLRWEVQFAIHSFYDARLTSWLIDDKLIAIKALNDELSGVLAELFRHTSSVGMLLGIPRHIRRLLSQLHLQFQELSRMELQLRQAMVQMNTFIERRSDMLGPLRPYLNDYAGQHDDIDKDTQLRLMDYAGSEAINVGVIQATVWASVIGAFVGILMTILLS